MEQTMHNGGIPNGLKAAGLHIKGFTWYYNGTGHLEGYKTTKWDRKNATKDYPDGVPVECVRWLSNCRTESELREFTKTPPRKRYSPTKDINQLKMF